MLISEVGGVGVSTWEISLVKVDIAKTLNTTRGRLYFGLPLYML